ncbi:MAG: mechanosensitive ion channel family protein, partial [Candidatus Binatia bacterium]
ATIAEGANMVLPDQPPLWRRNLGAQLARERPEFISRFTDFHSSTVAYVSMDPRPFVLQLLVGLMLMVALRGLPEGSKRRMNESQVSPETLRLLQRPYAIAMLLMLMLSPAMHPTAPHRVMQFIGIVALFPVARILMLASNRAHLSLYAGLFFLLLIDRLAIALSALPAVTLAIFLVELSVAFSLALEYRRRLVATQGAPWVIGLLTLGLAGIGMSMIAEIGGWSSLASLIGRGMLVSGAGALYAYAATISLEALFAYALASPALRSSRFVDRNQAMVQRWASVALRVIGSVYWLQLLISSLGLRDVTADGVAALMAAGISVGALSISVGGVLAFILTLVFARFFSRFVQELLEDEVFPRTKLPRGIPHALLTLTRYAIYSMGFLLALAAAGLQLGQLSILLGGLGVGIGLGLQDLVKNFAAGITILLERRVHVGDAVEIPDKKVFGRVLAIGMRASVVRNWNGTEVIMPNDDLVSGTVTNWTLSDVSHRLEVKVGVAYGTDPETVIDLLLGVAGADDRILASPPPAALFTGFGDSSLDFVLRAWSDEQYETAAAQTSQLGVAVHHALREAGITIPFPQRDVHIIAATSAESPSA